MERALIPGMGIRIPSNGGYGREEGQVYSSRISKNLMLYAVRNGAYFARERPYDFPDDMRRFMFSQKPVMNWRGLLTSTQYMQMTGIPDFCPSLQSVRLPE